MLVPNNPVYYKAKSIYDFRVTDLNGDHIKLDKYKGCVCIIVNTATKSDLTDIHYTQFNSLMDEYGESQGLRILAFPCNQFENEEPCTSEEIAKHAQQYNAKFDIFEKVNVNCRNAIPLYKYLKKRLGGNKLGDMIKSSYTKFLINRSGIPVERCGPDILPNEMRKMLKFYLKEDYVAKNKNTPESQSKQDIAKKGTEELKKSENSTKTKKSQDHAAVQNA